MGLKVLLVLPIREGHNVQIAPDLGILYVGTTLRNHGFDVTLLDCTKDKLTFRDFKSFLARKDLMSSVSAATVATTITSSTTSRSCDRSCLKR